MHVRDVHAEAGCRIAADDHVDVAATGQPLGQGAGHAGHILQHAFDLTCQPIDRREVGAGDLHADRALDSGGQHVDAVAYRRHPDVGQARHLDDAVEFLDQLVLRHARPPLLARLELDRRLEHLQRRRIGGRLGTACLAEHAGDFGHRLDQAVGLLQQFRCLARRQAGQR